MNWITFIHVPNFFPRNLLFLHFLLIPLTPIHLVSSSSISWLFIFRPYHTIFVPSFSFLMNCINSSCSVTYLIQHGNQLRITLYIIYYFPDHSEQPYPFPHLTSLHSNRWESFRSDQKVYVPLNQTTQSRLLRETFVWVLFEFHSVRGFRTKSFIHN